MSPHRQCFKTYRQIALRWRQSREDTVMVIKILSKTKQTVGLPKELSNRVNLPGEH